MSQLVQIQGYCFVALKDNKPIDDVARESFLTKTRSDFPASQIDIPTSLVLLHEMTEYPANDTGFVNELENQYPETTRDDEFVYIYPIYSVKSNQIPDSLKSAGLKILRQKRIGYLKHQETNTEQPYALINKDGTLYDGEKYDVAQGNSNTARLEINIFDDVLALTHDEYQRYLQTKHLIDTGTRTSDISRNDLYLWALTETFPTRREKLDVVFHELRHAKNNLILSDYTVDNPTSTFSGTDIYKQCMDDELSAKIAETIESINSYYTSQNKHNLSMFFENEYLYKLLYNQPQQEIDKILLNIPGIVELICSYWKAMFADRYVPQFLHNTEKELKSRPLSQISETPNNEGYEAIRKKMFTFSVYNPKTGNYINMDLSEHVKKHTLDDNITDIVKEIQTNVIAERQEQYNMYIGRADKDIINSAHVQHNVAIASTKYRQRLQTYRDQGIGYSIALDIAPSMNVVAEGTETLDLKEPEPVRPAITPTHIAPRTIEDSKPVVILSNKESVQEEQESTKTKLNRAKGNIITRLFKGVFNKNKSNE